MALSPVLVTLPENTDEPSALMVSLSVGVPDKSLITKSFPWQLFSVTFDNAYCPNAFCSPCRASLLTGLLPSQHGVHSWIDTRKKEDWPLGWHALDGLRTLPMSLSENGYKTALVGKYHLGETEITMPGFDHWVTMEDGHVRSFYRNQVTENGKNYLHEGHTVDFFTDKAVSFIDEQVESACD